MGGWLGGWVGGWVDGIQSCLFSFLGMVEPFTALKAPGDPSVIACASFWEGFLAPSGICNRLQLEPC